MRKTVAIGGLSAIGMQVARALLEHVGAWEGTLMLLPNRGFRDVLVVRGYDVTYRELTGGHDFVAWRGTFADGLIALAASSVHRTKAAGRGTCRSSKHVA